VVGVAAGYSHSLFLTSAGTVYASGRNGYGRLGDGTTTDRSTPVQVAAGVPNVVGVAAGSAHSLFLTSAGTVYASGSNNYGQLGDGTTTWGSTPVAGVTAAGVPNVVGVAAGDKHSLFLTSAGTVYASGYNGNGQLGDGTTTQRSTPVQVAAGVPNVVGVAAGNLHSLFLTSAGTVYASGYNGYGQLGDGTTTDRSTPVQGAAGVLNVAGVAAGGSHSLFLTSAGTVYASGRNDYGQLGDGTTTDRRTPVQVGAGVLSDVVGVAAGWHSLFLTSAGTVYASGRTN
jgi:alpha-tubulin suppressor-like RCC1 family protein